MCRCPQLHPFMHDPSNERENSFLFPMHLIRGNLRNPFGRARRRRFGSTTLFTFLFDGRAYLGQGSVIKLIYVFQGPRIMHFFLVYHTCQPSPSRGNLSMNFCRIDIRVLFHYALSISLSRSLARFLSGFEKVKSPIDRLGNIGNGQYS